MKKIFALTIVLLMTAAQASAMSLAIHDKIGHITLGNNFTLQISGYTSLDGDLSRGVATFGDLYFHFDALLIKEKMPLTKTVEEEQFIFDMASRFGGGDIANTVPVFVFEGGTDIFPINGDDGHEFYLLKTETGGGESSTVIGERNGKWVKYFNTIDVKRQLKRWDFYLQRYYVEGDTIICEYEQENTQRRYEIRYKWDEVAQWFGVEVTR